MYSSKIFMILSALALVLLLAAFGLQLKEMLDYELFKTIF